MKIITEVPQGEMSTASERAEIKSVNELLSMNLNIPDYQRPYKWDIQNIDDLFLDITNAISDADRYRTEFKYRIGSLIIGDIQIHTEQFINTLYFCSF